MNISELNEYFLKHNLSTYERSNYDEFLKDVCFSFSLKAIHITGSNGKGSLANYLYHIYLSEGYKVGLYISPFASSITETILANDKHISDEELLDIFNKYQDKFEQYHLTSFEMQTFIAYSYFSSLNLDLVIIEVGMGGYIDATNVITPLLSVITNVSLEHTSYLGRSVSEIAFNKAGIIKDNSLALVGKLDDNAMYAVKEYAKALRVEVNRVNDFHNVRVLSDHILFDYYPLKDLRLNTLATYQCENASLAVEAAQLLKDKLPIKESSIRKGLECLNLACRFELVRKNLLIDGAHNPDGIDKLVKSLENESRTVHVVFASFKDKNIESMLILLGNLSHDITLTTFPHKRARTEEDYFLYLGDYQFDENYLSLIKNKMNEFPDDLVLVTGSLAFAYLVKKEI